MKKQHKKNPAYRQTSKKIFAFTLGLFLACNLFFVLLPINNALALKLSPIITVDSKEANARELFAFDYDSGKWYYHSYTGDTIYGPWHNVSNLDSLNLSKDFVYIAKQLNGKDYNTGSNLLNNGVIGTNGMTTPTTPAAPTPTTPAAPIQFTPNVTIGKFTAGVAQDFTNSTFADYVNVWYNFIVGIVGIIATVMIMWGGMKWLTSRGNSGTINEAKETIFSGIIGLVLVMLSYTILQYVNPRLLTMTMPDKSASTSVQACTAKAGEFCLNVPLGNNKTVASFPEYIGFWYQLLVGVIGVLATVMIMWGGMKWLTSRGNSGTINEAKDTIFSAIVGLIIMFGSYTILYMVNPELVKISMPELGPGVASPASPGSGVSSASGGSGAGGSGGGNTGGGKLNDRSTADCSNATAGVVSYDPSLSNMPPLKPPAMSPEINGWINTYSDKYNVDANALRALVAIESGGNTNVPPSGSNAFGLTQLLPGTAQGVVKDPKYGADFSSINASSIDGNWLMANPEKNIAIGAAYFSQANDIKNPITNKPLNLPDKFAYYNGGPNAVAPSVDCQDGMRYNCCHGNDCLLYTSPSPRDS